MGLSGEREANSHLQVNHVSWKRDLGVLSRVHNWDVCLPYFFFHESCTGGKGGMHKCSCFLCLQNQKKRIKFTISVNVVAKNLNFTKFVCPSVRRSEDSAERYLKTASELNLSWTWLIIHLWSQNQHNSQTLQILFYPTYSICDPSPHNVELH